MKFGFGLLSGLPVLTWLRRLVGWTSVLLAGVTLGSLIFLMILAS